MTGVARAHIEDNALSTVEEGVPILGKRGPLAMPSSDGLDLPFLSECGESPLLRDEARLTTRCVNPRATGVRWTGRIQHTTLSFPRRLSLHGVAKP
jgi:hypothetical protein